MKITYSTALLTVFVISSFANILFAQEQKETKFGIGFQASPFPIFGLSAIYNTNKNLSFQCIGRVGIDVDFFAFRALYRIKTEKKYNVYINGMIGYFTDGDVQVNIFARSETDKTWGIGGGAGFEYFFSKLPRFGWNLEVDFVYIDFEKKWWKYDYHAWSLLMLGMGVHYYF